MPKCMKIFFWAAFLLITISTTTFANPIATDIYGGNANSLLSLQISLVALLIEYFSVRLLLQKWVNFKQALPLFLIINMISFPITFIAAPLMAWFAEIIPLMIEPSLYSFGLKRWNIEVPDLTYKIIIANLISFGSGLTIYFMLPQSIRFPH